MANNKLNETVNNESANVSAEALDGKLVDVIKLTIGNLIEMTKNAEPYLLEAIDKDESLKTDDPDQAFLNGYASAIHAMETISKDIISNISNNFAKARKEQNLDSAEDTAETEEEPVKAEE